MQTLKTENMQMLEATRLSNIFPGQAGKAIGQFVIANSSVPVLFELLDKMLKDYDGTNNDTFLTSSVALADIILAYNDAKNIREIILAYPENCPVNILTYLMIELNYTGVACREHGIVFPKLLPKIENSIDWEDIMQLSARELPIWSGYQGKSINKNFTLSNSGYKTVVIASRLIYKFLRDEIDIMPEINLLVNELLIKCDNLESLLDGYKSLYQGQKGFVTPMTFIFMHKGYTGVSIPGFARTFPTKESIDL